MRAVIPKWCQRVQCIHPVCYITTCLACWHSGSDSVSKVYTVFACQFPVQEGRWSPKHSSFRRWCGGWWWGEFCGVSKSCSVSNHCMIVYTCSTVCSVVHVRKWQREKRPGIHQLVRNRALYNYTLIPMSGALITYQGLNGTGSSGHLGGGGLSNLA